MPGIKLTDYNDPSFNSVLASGFNHPTFVAWIKSILAIVGFPTPIESVVNTTDPSYLVYRLIFGSFTYSDVYFIVYIPQFTTGDFDVYTGLCHHAFYDTNTFRFTQNFINAGGGKDTSSAIPSQYANFTFNNIHSYTSMNLKTYLDLKGAAIQISSGSDVLNAFLGVAVPDVLYSEYDFDQSSYVMLPTRNFLTRVVSPYSTDSSSTTPFSIAAPFHGITSFINNRSICVNPLMFRPDSGETAPNLGQTGSFQFKNTTGIEVFYDVNPYYLSQIGNFSPELVVGLSDAPAGGLLTDIQTSKNYVVINPYGQNSECVLAYQIDPTQ